MLSTIIAVARAAVECRGIPWLAVADDCIQEARAELLACKLQVPVDPAHARAKIRLIIRRAVVRWLDEQLPTIRVPASSARRGKRLKRRRYDEHYAARREDQGKACIAPPQRRAEGYWTAVEALTAAAERMADQIDSRLPVAVAGLLDGLPFATAARAARLGRAPLLLRLRQLAPFIARAEPAAFAIFFNAVETAKGRNWWNR